MTYKERLLQEHPEYVGPEYDGGCKGCPDDYGYEEDSTCACRCEECWNREIEKS